MSADELLASLKRRAVAQHCPLWFLLAPDLAWSESWCGFHLRVSVPTYAIHASTPCHDPMPDTMRLMALTASVYDAATPQPNPESE